MLATLPTGFYENATISARASYIAGKPVTIGCAGSDDVWTSYVASLAAAGNPPENGIANGYTPETGGGVSLLSPETCAPLLARIGGHSVLLPTFGAALDVLGQEAFRLQGVSGNGQSQCSAYKAVGRFAVARWGFKRGSLAYQSVLRGAASFHRRLAADYRSVC